MTSALFWFLWITSLILALALTLWQWRRRAPFRHYGLGFRLVLLVVAWWSVQATFQPFSTYRPPLWVLVDTSHSFRHQLGIPATAEGAIAEMLPQTWKETIQNEFPDRELQYLNWFNPQSTDLPFNWQPTSPLEDKLLEFLRQSNLPPESEILLLTDGNDTESIESEAFLARVKQYNLRLHTLAWPTEATSDLELRLDGNVQVAFVNEALSIPVTVHADAINDLQEVEVVLTDGLALLDKQTIRLEAGETTYPITMRWTPSRVGDQLLQLRLAPLAEEKNLQNNLVYLPVEVRSNRLKVLHIAGRTSWDVRYLRGLLKESPEIDLISFFILRDPFEDSHNIPESELALIQFPVEELFMVQLFKFDVVVFHNFTIKKYLRNRAFQRSFQKFLADGKRIVVVGGDQTEGNRGFAELFLRGDDALTWEWPLSHNDRWDFAETELLPPEHAQHQAAFEWKPTRGGPPVETLLRTSFGLGRVDWVTDPFTWRWTQPEAADQPPRQQHTMFWQTLLYQPFFERQQVFEDFRNHRPFHLSDQIAGNLHLPTQSKTATLHVVDLQTGQTVEELELTVQSQTALLELPTKQAGTYEMRVRCECDDMPELRHPLIIVDEWLELHRTRANTLWLKSLSSATGGRLISLQQQ